MVCNEEQNSNCFHSQTEDEEVTSSVNIQNNDRLLSLEGTEKFKKLYYPILTVCFNQFTVQSENYVCNDKQISDVSDAVLLDIDFSDVANYPSDLTQHFLERIIRTGPFQIVISFPKSNGRSFSEFFYTKNMKNGEKVKRDWLIYSKILDAVHCFCCRIFQEKTTRFAFSSIE